MRRATDRRWQHRWQRLAVALLAIALLTHCKFLGIGEQQALLRERCELAGTVAPPIAGVDAERRAQIVMLLRAGDSGWLIADHYITNLDGKWSFTAEHGDYGLLAFADDPSRTLLAPGAHWNGAAPSLQLHCANGERLGALHLQATADPRLDRIAQLAPDAQVPITLGALTAHGVVTTLDDPSFDPAIADMGLWQPVEFLKQARPGIYFLQRYEADRIPVLYVHGIDDTPRRFTALIEQLDRRHFQPWVYFYPTSADLDVVADHLQQTVAKLQRTYRFHQLVVIAHSMGGLPARSFILRSGDDGVAIPLFISMATPFGGNDGAATGATHAPTPLPAWIDLAPDSRFLRELFYRDPEQMQQPKSLPARTAHHLFFSFQRRSNSFGPSSDGTIPLARQLPSQAQRDATRLHGIDASHVAVVQNAAVVAQINALLAALPASPD